MHDPQVDKRAAREGLFLDRMVEDVSVQLSPGQRMLIGILATESEHGTDSYPLLKALAKETRSSRTGELAETLARQGEPEKTRQILGRLLPGRIAKAIDSMSSELKAGFYGMWLRHNTNDQANVVRHEQTLTSRAIRLVFKVWFVGVMLSFIGFNILPEFRAMAEEFGIERAGEFPLLISIVLMFAYVSAILSLLMVIVFVLLLFFRNNRFFVGYLKRWHPWNWRRVTLSKGTQKRQSLAWRIQSMAFGDSTGNRGLDWAQEVEQGTLATRQANQLSRIGDRETQAWIVENLAESGRFIGEDRREWLFQVLVTVVHLILVVAVFIAAWSMLNFLITIMSGVS